MKFLSDILAKAGLTVDGVVTLNNTATGQTPNANDNSTKLATTAWVRTFVQPYSLPIATASILGGIKVGEGLSINASTGVLSTVGGASITSFRSEYIITATAGQITFTVPNGYTPGKIDLFLNGVYLNDNIYTATNSSTIVLDDAAALDDILTVFVYSTYYVGDSPSARTTTYFTATSNQTVFTVAYVIGQVDIFYNGSKLEPSEYTANNGTSITLLTAATTGDKIEVVNWAVGGGIASTRTITINGVTYDLSANRTWTLTTANISEVTNLYYTDARARAAISESVTGLDYNSATGVFSTTTGYGIPTTSSQTNWDAAYNDKINSAAVTGTTTKTLTLTQQDGGTITASWTDDNTDAVTSIFGRTGVVVATSGDYTTTLVTEGTNLYYTDVRSRTAISLTTTGTSGAATYDNTTGIINIPQYQGGVTSFNTRTGAITLSSSDVTTALTYTPVTNARTLTINGTTYDLTADRSWSIAAGVTSFNTRTGAISLTSLDVTDALTYTPVTNARTLTINGTSYDLSANRSWTIAPDVSVRNTYAFTATAAQTTFTVSGGYTVGLVDVFINGVKLAAADFTATNGTTVVLGTGTGVGNIVEIIKYVSAFTAAQEALNGTGLVRMSGTTVSYDNATYATQSYVTTAVANLVDAAPSTLDTLNELAAALGDDPNFATTIATSIGTKQPQLNGTGFVKISGTTISYDNSTYLTTASASSTYLPLAGGTLTGALSGTSASFSGNGLFGGSTNIGNPGTFSLSVGLAGTTAGGIQLWAATNQAHYLQFGDGTTGGQVYAGYIGYAHGTDTLSFGTATADRLTIASTGAATFTSTISTPSFISSDTEFRLGAAFARVATLDAGGGFGGGYNLNWNNGSPIHNSIGTVSGYGYANDGSVRFYANVSSAANTTALLRFNIGSDGSIAMGNFSPSGTPTSDYRSFEIGRQGNTIAGAPWKSNLYLSTNATITAGSTAFTYRFSSVPSTLLSLEGGTLSFSNAPAGTVGNTISFAQQFNISSTGAATFSSFVTATNLYLGSLTNEQLMISGSGSRGIGVSTITSGDPFVRLYDNTTIKGDIWWGRSGGYMGVNSLGTGSITAINPFGGNILLGTSTEYGSGFRLQVNGSAYITGIVYSNAGFYINSGQYNSIAETPYTGMYMTGSSSSDGFGALLITSRTDIARPIIFGTSNGSVSVERFRIAPGGAATFSSSISATTSINAGSIVSANQGFYTTNSIITVPFTTWTEIKALDANIEAMYLFVIGLTGQASSDWSASGILITGGGSDGRWIVGPTNGTVVQIRISGTSVQVYQNGTSPNIGLSYKMLRIG